MLRWSHESIGLVFKAALGVDCHPPGGLHDEPRSVDRQRGTARHGLVLRLLPGPGGHAGLLVLGAQRLRHRSGGPPRRRGPHGRPDRTAAGVPRRRHRLHPRLARLRPGAGPGDPRGRPSPPGGGRRGSVAHLPGTAAGFRADGAPHPCHPQLGGRGRARRRGPRRRRTAGPGRLALGLRDQRSDRHRHRGRGAACPALHRTQGAGPPARPGGRPADHPRDRRPVRRAGAGAGMGLAGRQEPCAVRARVGRRRRLRPPLAPAQSPAVRAALAAPSPVRRREHRHVRVRHRLRHHAPVQRPVVPGDLALERPAHRCGHGPRPRPGPRRHPAHRTRRTPPGPRAAGHCGRTALRRIHALAGLLRLPRRRLLARPAAQPGPRRRGRRTDPRHVGRRRRQLPARPSGGHRIGPGQLGAPDIRHRGRGPARRRRRHARRPRPAPGLPCRMAGGGGAECRHGRRRRADHPHRHTHPRARRPGHRRHRTALNHSPVTRRSPRPGNTVKDTKT
ncbi:hypothetical protein SGPA1_41198 [Streptomyces misionensis JCM 4497]